jgi:hypothetical protein
LALDPNGLVADRVFWTGGFIRPTRVERVRPDWAEVCY